MPVYLSIAGLIVLTLVFIYLARPGGTGAVWDKSPDKGKASERRSEPRTEDENKTAEENTPVRRPAEYKTLVGRWLRGDGDYVIAVRRVDRDGTADVSYFNPQPINVSEAATLPRKGTASSCSSNCATSVIRGLPTG